MNLNVWLKRIVTTTAITALCAWMVPAALAAENSTNVDPKIVQVVDPLSPLALDDQGNIWCMAFHSISVKDGFHPVPMVKVNGFDKVVSISHGSDYLALREDGTVWTIERNTGSNQRTYTIMSPQCSGNQSLIWSIL